MDLWRSCPIDPRASGLLASGGRAALAPLEGKSAEGEPAKESSTEARSAEAWQAWLFGFESGDGEAWVTMSRPEAIRLPFGMSANYMPLELFYLFLEKFEACMF